MKFEPTPLPGAYLLSLDEKTDGRGTFARTFCANEFKEHGLNPTVAQTNLSFNLKRGTLRGMHFQAWPKPECKVVRCTRGRIFDVIVDLRRNSSSYLKWFGIELSDVNRKSLYIPEGFAHGFQTLEENCEVLYLMSEFFNEKLSHGLRYNDPQVNIRWPLPPINVSSRDRELPLAADLDAALISGD